MGRKKTTTKPKPYYPKKKAETSATESKWDPTQLVGKKITAVRYDEQGFELQFSKKLKLRGRPVQTDTGAPGLELFVVHTHNRPVEVPEKVNPTHGSGTTGPEYTVSEPNEELMPEL